MSGIKLLNIVERHLGDAAERLAVASDGDSSSDVSRHAGAISALVNLRLELRRKMDEDRDRMGDKRASVANARRGFPVSTATA